MNVLMSTLAKASSLVLISLSITSPGHSKPVYLSQIDSYVDSTIDPALFATTRKECLDVFQTNLIKVKEIQNLHNRCLKTSRSGPIKGNCTHPQCEQAHNLGSSLSKDAYAARTACYARVRAKESIEDAIADQLPTAVTKANTLRTMWNSAVNMRDNCANFTKGTSAESCVSATGEMMENLRGFVSADGIVKAIQDEVFRKVLDHHNNLAKQVDQLVSTIDKIGNKPPKSSNWRQVINRSNSELLNAGWTEQQIAEMRSWQRTSSEREKQERRATELPSMREAMIENPRLALTDNPESTIARNNRDARIKVASYIQSSTTQHNTAMAKLDKAARQTAKSSYSSDDTCTGDGYAANMTPKLCRQCKQMAKDAGVKIENYKAVDTQGSACLAQRVVYKTLKLLVPISQKCETPDVVTHYKSEINNLKLNNTCNDGIEGPLY